MAIAFCNAAVSSVLPSPAAPKCFSWNVLLGMTGAGGGVSGCVCVARFV
jgi:hypothetical protein